jgi:hypothetical protein
VHREVARVDVCRKHRNVTPGKIGKKRGRLHQVRETEERRYLSTGSSAIHSANAHLNFLLRLCGVAGIGVSRQILVRPRMRTDRHAGIDHLPRDLGMPTRIFADLEERRLHTLVSKRLEHASSADRPGTIVERQNDFVVAKETLVASEMLETEFGPSGRIDLHDARKSESIGLVAGRNAAVRRPLPRCYCGGTLLRRASRGS